MPKLYLKCGKFKKNIHKTFSAKSITKGPVTLCNFLSNLSRNAPRNVKQEVCACALVKTAVKLRDKLLEW